MLTNLGKIVTHIKYTGNGIPPELPIDGLWTLTFVSGGCDLPPSPLPEP